MEEEYQAFYKPANEKFKNGFLSFRISLDHKTYSIKYLRSTYTKINGGYQITYIFKITQETDPKLDRVIVELRRKLKKHRHKRIRFRYRP